ncbi:hypothetical protein D3C84_1097160 [compost metagenome]
MGVEQVLLGYKLHQFLLHLDHIFAGSNTGTVADPENMGVHRHGQLAKGGIEHHVRCLAADAG